MTDLLYVRNRLPELKSIGLLEKSRFWLQFDRLMSNWTDVSSFYIDDWGVSEEAMTAIGRGLFDTTRGGVSFPKNSKLVTNTLFRETWFNKLTSGPGQSLLSGVFSIEKKNLSFFVVIL